MLRNASRLSIPFYLTKLTVQIIAMVVHLDQPGDPRRHQLDLRNKVEGSDAGQEAWDVLALVALAPAGVDKEVGKLTGEH